jgi:hypothetical protein
MLTHAIDFLIGHEFTHRMQDLSTAAYGSFKEAVIKFLGENVWNAHVDAMVALYESIKRYNDSNLLPMAYSCEVTEEELLDGHWITHTRSADFIPTPNNSITATKLLKGVKKNNSNEVVLQENLQDENFKTDTKADSHRGDIAKLMQKIFIYKKGDVIYFEDDEMELPAIEVRPRTTEGMIKIYMDKRHLAAKAAS